MLIRFSQAFPLMTKVITETMEKGKENGNMHDNLVHLFDLELQATGMFDAPSLTSPEGRVGKILGGGEGTVKGPRLQGTVRWEIYCSSPGESTCKIEFPGLIETNDGAKIRFETIGEAGSRYTKRPKAEKEVFSMRFQTEDERYAWLNKLLAIGVGEIDTEKWIHRDHIYASREDVVSE